MLKCVILCTALLLVVSVTLSFAVDPKKKHPIDLSLDDCIAKDSSTAGMAQCTRKAEEMWDRELNKVYNELASNLSAEEKEALKTAQKNWIQYRDSEFELLNVLYATMEGTMYIPMRAGARMEIVKKRALELQDHLDLVRER